MEPRTMQNARHGSSGRDFESIFEKLARLQGLLARKIPLSCRVYQDQAGLTRYVPIDSELDWQLVDRRTGRVAFIDTKSFQGDRYPVSSIEDHQINTARVLSEWGQTAGFLVWFRKQDKVVFFHGRHVAGIARGSLGPEDGVHLGTGFDFQLGKLFQ